MEIYAINGGHKVRLTKSSIQNYIQLGYSIFTPYVPDDLSEVGRAGTGAGLITEWDGEGLPPVGCVVELMDDSQSATWGNARIKFWGDSFAVWDDHGEECSNSLCHVKVRPIRSEAYRKRDEAASSVQALFDSYNEDVGNDELARFGERVVQKIAAGKIPGIRIE